MGNLPRGERSAKSLLGNLSLLVLFSLIAFALGEIFVRLAFDVNVFPRFHSEAQYGEFRLRSIRPKTTFWHTSLDGRWRFQTNNKGFRDTRDFNYEKPQGVFRVLVLGDSNAQGYEVRQGHTFSAVLEKKLRLSGIKAEVINTGVSGFSTAEELLMLENEGIRFQPDVVVLAYFANDLNDNIRSNLFAIDKNDELSTNGRTYLPGVAAQEFVNSLAPLRWLSQNSRFYSLLVNKVWSYARRKLSSRTREQLFESATVTSTEVSDYSQRLGTQLILRMSKYCQTKNTALLVIDVPAIKSPDQIQDSMSAEMSRTLRNGGVDLVSGRALVDPYSGLIDLHLPHGHRHISEFTHLMIGIDLADRLQQNSGL